jgi:hypothetical protein
MNPETWKILREHLHDRTADGNEYTVPAFALQKQFDLSDNFLDELKARLTTDSEVGLREGFDLTFGRKNK